MKKTISYLLLVIKENVRNVFLAVCAGAFIYLLALLFTGDHYWCFKDHDTCSIEVMNYYRDIRDQKIKDENDRHTKTMATINTYYNDQKINPIKTTLSAGKVIEEYKKGNKQNVPEGFVALRQAFGIPQAYASTGDTILDAPNSHSNIESAGITRWAKQISVGRYGKVLANLGSPYASVSIEQYCNREGISEQGCDILVGIAHAESTSGTNFKCNWKTTDEAIKLGQSYYFNPVGRFNGSYYLNGRKVPDENGCYLQKFSSWDDFWAFYANKMANNLYNFKERTEAYTMYLPYVKGDMRPWETLTQREKNAVMNSSWVQANNTFVSLVKLANS